MKRIMGPKNLKHGWNYQSLSPLEGAIPERFGGTHGKEAWGLGLAWEEVERVGLGLAWGLGVTWTSALCASAGLVAWPCA